MHVGERVSSWRRAKGMTQRALAHAADLSVAAISQCESGIHSLSQPSLERVVSALGLTMERFYGRIPRSRKKAA